MNIYALVAADAGMEVLYALDGRVDITGVITTEPYFHLRAFELSSYPLVLVDDYTLQSPASQKTLEKIDIDLILVLGWQRLVPEWLLRQCRVGAIGIHGSAYGIEQGRGRSPQNWAILMGEDRFKVCLFWLTAGVDDGSLLACDEFPYTASDDIVSSQLKVALVVADMLARALHDGAVPKSGIEQSGPFAYLPKRTPDDGLLDWRSTTHQIDRQVRALTRPYPGARSATSGGAILIIWRGRPLSYGGSRTAAPGTIVQKSVHGAFVVATRDGFFMVDDWTPVGGEFDPRIDDQLPSVDACKLHEEILHRHYERYPNQPLNETVVRGCTGE